MTSMDLDIEPPSFVMQVAPGSPPEELPRELNPRFLLEQGTKPRKGDSKVVNDATLLLVGDHDDDLSSRLELGTSSLARTSTAASQDVKLPPEGGSVARILSFREDPLTREEKDSTHASIPSSAPTPENRRRSVETLSTCLHERHEEHRRQIQQFQVERNQWQAEVEGMKASLQQQEALRLQHLLSLKTELEQHYEQEMQLEREQHQADLVESTRLASQQTAEYRRFKASLRAQVETLQRQWLEASEKNENLELELQGLRQQHAKLESSQTKRTADMERRLQRQVDDVQTLRAKLERQENEYRSLEDELLEALDHIEDTEELNSLEIYELNEKIRSQSQQNEELKAQLEETVSLAEKMSDQLLLSKTSPQNADHLKSLAIRLAAVTRHFLLDRFPNARAELPDINGPGIDTGSLLPFVELAEGFHAQILLDQTLDGDFLLDDDNESVSSNKSSRSLQPPSKVPAKKSRIPAQERPSSSTIPSSITTQHPRRVSNSMGHSSAARGEARVAQTPFRDKANDDKAVASSHSSSLKGMKRRSLADVSGSRGSSLKPISRAVSKLARPVAGKQRSALQKYGPRSVLQTSHNGSITANPAPSAAVPATYAPSTINSVARELHPQTTRNDSLADEWTNVGRQFVDDATDNKPSATPRDKLSASTRRHTLAVESRPTTAMSLARSSAEWSDSGRRHVVQDADAQRGRASGPSKPREAHWLGLSETGSTRDGAITSPVIESSPESKVSPKAIIREVIKSLTPRGDSSMENRVPETPREVPLPTEAIDMTPSETTVETKFETLVSSWSTSMPNAHADSPTGLVPSSLCFSTHKKVKRGSESSTAPRVVSTVDTSKASDLPSNKRIKRDPAVGRKTPAREHEKKESFQATPFSLREDIVALFSPEELLLSPSPAGQKLNMIRTAVNTLDYSPIRSLEPTTAAVGERTDAVQMTTSLSGAQPMNFLQEGITAKNEECTTTCSDLMSRDESTTSAGFLLPEESRDCESGGHSTLQLLSASFLARVFKAYKVRTCYKQWRKSAIRLQALYRGASARSVARKRRDEAISRSICAVIVIQATWRSRDAQRYFSGVIRAVLLLQSATRLFMARRRLQKSKVVAASTRVQAAWRRHLARVGYDSKICSVCVLQAFARKFRARIEYQRLRSAGTESLAAVGIQRAWRCASSRRAYIVSQKSALLIQSVFRGVSARRAINSSRRRSASTRIQAAWKRHIYRKKFEASRRAMILIQTCVRTGLAKGKFEELHLAHRMGTSSSTIQRAWRCVSARRSYIDCLCAAMLIQSVYRGFVARQHIRAHRHNRAAHCIQASWRRQVKHVEFRTFHRNIILVQSFVRQKQAVAALELSKVARDTRIAALIVQRSWRRRSARRKFLGCLFRAVLIQSAFRRFVVLQTHKNHRKNVACSLVQATWKCHVHRKSYDASRRAAILVQSLARTQQARAKLRSLKLARKQEDMALKIQLLWRGSYARRAFIELLCNAMLIQSVFRGFLVRQKLKSSRENAACTFIQVTWRLYKARKEYECARRATILFQALVRSRLANARLECLKTARGRELAALDIQRLFRGNYARSLLKVAREMERTASSIQRFWRFTSARRSYERSARLIQATLRAFLARKLRNRVAHIIGVCTIIQAAWRGHFVRNQYQRFTVSAVRVQAMIRGALARAEAAIIQSAKEGRHNAALSIQATWRSWSGRRKVLAILSAATAIQSTIRRRLACNLCSQLRELNAGRAACLRIQSTWKGYVHRKEYSKALRSLIVIQATARMHMAKSEVRTLRSGHLLLLRKVIALQSIWRCFVARRHYCNAINNKRAFAIQTRWRASRSRNLFCRMKVSSVRIQSATRRLLARRLSRMLLVSIRKIQACHRGAAHRRSFRNKLRALAILQATGRRIVARRALKERQSIIAATSIQRFFRGSLVRQQGKNWLRAALVLQKSWRGYSTYRRYRLAILRAAMDSKACQTSSKVERRHRGDIESTLAPISETPARPTNQRLGAATTDASSQARKPMFSTRRPLGDLDMTVKTSAGSRTNARATRSRGQLKLEAYEQTLNVNRSTSRDDVEKLKVVELRDILRQRGIESKLYRNLRKAELIEMVLQNDD